MSNPKNRVIALVQPIMANMLSPLKLGKLLNHLPDNLNLFVVDKVINKVFAEQISEGDFDFLTRRKLQIHIMDANIYVLLSYSSPKLKCLNFSDSENHADVTLSIDSKNAIQLIQQKTDPDTLFFQRKLKINGDTELAHQVKNTIDTIDPATIPKIASKLSELYYEKILLAH